MWLGWVCGIHKRAVTPATDEVADNKFPSRLVGLTVVTSAAFFSGAMAAWTLGTGRTARVIEITSLLAGVIGYWVGSRLRKRTPTMLVLVGYILFWVLAVVISACWILMAAKGGSRGT